MHITPSKQPRLPGSMQQPGLTCLRVMSCGFMHAGKRLGPESPRAEPASQHGSWHCQQLLHWSPGSGLRLAGVLHDHQGAVRLRPQSSPQPHTASSPGSARCAAATCVTHNALHITHQGASAAGMHRPVFTLPVFAQTHSACQPFVYVPCQLKLISFKDTAQQHHTLQI